MIQIIIIALAFAWLGYETDWMRVRLPLDELDLSGTSRGIEQRNRELEPARREYAEQQATMKASKQAHTRQLVEQSGRKWQFLKYGGDCVMMRDRCYIVHCNLCRQDDRFFAWRIPARTVKVFGSTINFKEGCNLYRAKLLKDIVKAQKSKTPPTYKRTLPPVSWYPTEEASIELLVDGKAVANINGEYKRGMIKEALKPYTTKARVGKRTVTWDFGEADRLVKV